MQRLWLAIAKNKKEKGKKEGTNSEGMEKQQILNCKVEKSDPFSARLPHQNIVPLPEADRREAEEERNQVFEKGGKNALNLVKFEIGKFQKNEGWKVENFSSQRLSLGPHFG